MNLWKIFTVQIWLAEKEEQNFAKQVTFGLYVSFRHWLMVNRTLPVDLD